MVNNGGLIFPFFFFPPQTIRFSIKEMFNTRVNRCNEISFSYRKAKRARWKIVTRSNVSRFNSDFRNLSSHLQAIPNANMRTIKAIHEHIPVDRIPLFSLRLRVISSNFVTHQRSTFIRLHMKIE